LVSLFSQVEKITQPYRTSNNGAWNIFPNQVDKEQFTPYTTALGLLVLLEAHESRLSWGGGEVERDDSIVRTANWLVDQFVDNDKERGWIALTWPEGRNDVSDGFNFMVFTLLLRADYLNIGFRMPQRLLDFLSSRLIELENISGVDAINRGVLSVRNGEAETFSEVVLNLYWYPWAVMCCQEWIKHLDNNHYTRLRFRKVLSHLILEGDHASLDDRVVAFKLAEYLYAMSVVAASPELMQQ